MSRHRAISARLAPPAQPPGEAPRPVGRGRCIRQTPRVLIVLSDSGIEHVLPRGALHPSSEVHRQGDAGLVVLRHYWFNRLGFSAQRGKTTEDSSGGA